MRRHSVKEVYDDCIVDEYGDRHYYKDNYMYKKTYHNFNVYYCNEFGKYHRLDGPAIEWSDGQNFYYIDGVHYLYKDWLEKVKEYG